MLREISKKVCLVANFGVAYTGLATVGYKLWNGDGTQFQARTTTGVSEIRAGTGSYKVEVANSVFTADFDGYVEWDTGGGSPVYAYEDIHITAQLDTNVGSRASQTSLDTVAGYVDTEVAAIKAKTDNLPSDPADASDIAASFSSIASTLATIASYIDTEVGAIKAKTDNLPGDPADASDIAALLATLSSAVAAVDTLATAIKVKTDALPSDPADASDVAAAITSAQSALADAITALGTPAQDSALAAAQTSLDQIVGYIDNEVGTIRNAE